MRKFLIMVAVAILICGASVMTSCSSESDNPSQEQARKNRKEFIEHTRSTLKDLAENMNFKAIPNLNRFLINFNNQVMLNDKYNHELALIFNQKIVESIHPVEEGSELSACRRVSP